MGSSDLIVASIKVIAIFSMVLGLVPLLIWMERKGAAYIQDRRGPNRAEILGIRLGGVIHSLADAIKLLTKEDVTVRAAYRPLYLVAPILALFVPCATVAVIPFAAPLEIGSFSFALQVADLRAGLVYVFAMSSLGVYALMLAGWSSGSKYPLISSLRAASQTISYELAMGLAALSLFIVAGSFSLPDIVADQGAFVLRWNAIRQPVAFILFFTAMLAEANRLPFDLPEGESEIVAGYHTEYSSMRFAMFFMGEYAHIIVGSAILATLFFGGWNVPFLSSEVMYKNFPLIVLIAWPMAGVGLLLFGGWLTGKFRRRYNDRRDFEPVIFGILAVAAGLLILFSYAAFGDVALPQWIANVSIFLLQVVMLLIKTLALCASFIWIRWTLPRFRYDQLMRLGWKVMLPLGMANALVTAVVVQIWQG